MKKTLAAIVITFAAITGSVFAHDCNMVIGGNLESATKNYENFTPAYKNALPTEAFRQALTNLKAYCCTSVDPSSCTQQEKDNLPKLYPESAYLFDHLVDVAMRRLDGIQSLAYNLEPDPTGKARREYITKVADDTVGVQASTIEKTYTGYRTLHTDLTKNLNIVIADYKDNKLETLSLADKYNTLCDVIKSIYEKVQTNNPIILGKWETNSFFNGCRNLVKERVKRENSYAKILMVKKSNQLLDETTKAYTKKYFVEEKLMALRNLVSKVKDMFQTIVKQAPASKTCSK